MSNAIERVALHETARQRYLNYAISVITSRALPDVRDGLKPVQRRILFSMHEMRLTPQSPYRKSAQVVGNTMGKLHPHGDSAIYEAMVRLAQSFSLRYPLVDGHGNFGSLDGDSAAAMRYTEARLTSLATELLQDLSEEIVDYKPTYDGSMLEPSVLPAQIPQLLINGATGIAVGMATNIPPHNIRETLDACIALVDSPNLDTAALLKLMPGPDFPTGGRVFNDPASLLQIYEHGQGSIDLHGEYTTEGEGKAKQIVITSIPYMVNKAQLIEKIAEHISGGKLPLVVDVRDESTTDVRVVLELKPGADPQAAMAYLYKHTPLRARFHVNMTCLVPDAQGVGRPARLGLRDMLRAFLDFRLQVVTRRLTVRSAELVKKIRILEALSKVAANPQVVVDLLRTAVDRPTAAAALCAKLLLDEDQSKAVLEMPLYRLVRVEVDELNAQLRELGAERAHVASLLESTPKRWALLREELKELRKRFGDNRRTLLGATIPAAVADYSEEAYIVDEDVFVIVTRQGWLKRQRSYTDVSTIRVREDDAIGWVFKCSTRRTLILFSDRGKAYTLRVEGLPQTSGYGDPVQARFEFEDGERIVGAAVSDPRSLPGPEIQEPDEELGPWLVAVTRAGMATRMGIAAFTQPSNVSGRRYMKPQQEIPGDGVVGVEVAWGPEAISLASKGARIMNVMVSDVPWMKNPAKGVKLISLDHTDLVAGFCLASQEHEGLSIQTARGLKKVISLRDFPPMRRSSPGRWLVKNDQVTVVQQPPVVVHGKDNP